MKFNENKEEYLSYLKNEPELKEPSLFQILLHNDEFTPMEFVISALEKFFFMNRTKAAEIMLEAHTKGMAICGTFTKDFAEAKMWQVLDFARINEHPLTCSMEAAV